MLRARAPGKVNLCLFLGEPRADGRHELVTLFESISLADELGLHMVVGDPASDHVACPGVEDPNLVAEALRLLRARGWGAPPVRIEIDKRLPIAGGMAGGSADAAAALRLAMALAPGRPEEVAEIAAALGADVPSQLAPGLVLGSAAGDEVEPFEPLERHALVIVPQPLALATAEVYREADRLRLPRPREELHSLHQELEQALRPGALLPERLLVNDLEPAALSLCPEISGALSAAQSAGSDHALVCGSGPTVIGLFWGADAQRRADGAARRLRDRYPGVISARPVTAEFGSPVFA